MKPPPRTGSKLANACLRWAYRAIKENTISMPAVGWTQTPDGLLPPFGGNGVSIYLFPFKFDRTTSEGDNGISIRYGKVTLTDGTEIIPTIDGVALSQTETNFLATYTDPETVIVGAVYLEISGDDSDEWTFTVTGIAIKWDADGTLPADTGEGTATAVHNLAIGTDDPSGPVNYFYSNLGLVRFGQAGAEYYLFGR